MVAMCGWGVCGVGGGGDAMQIEGEAPQYGVCRLSFEPMSCVVTCVSLEASMATLRSGLLWKYP